MGLGENAAEKFDLPRLFCPEDLLMDFDSQPASPSDFGVKVPVIGAGLLNLGNTCYLNSVVQSLIHTVPLFEILSSTDALCTCSDGDRTDNSGKFCSFCSLRQLASHCLNSSGKDVEPCALVNNLNNISPSFVIYQQEDAHEFLCLFLDALECSCNKPNDGEKEEGSFIKQIFGGCIQSRVRCCECGYCSDTFEPSLILSLEIEGVENLENALKSFTSTEKIDDPEIRFKCDGCDNRVLVDKQLSLIQLPQVLVLHLKRFKMNDSCNVKLDKSISFPLELDLNPFFSNMQDGVEFKYDLYAIVVHDGQTLHSGHYYSYVRTAPDLWHEMDDEKVTKVDAEHVRNQQAYILFYIKQGSVPWFSSFLEKKIAGTSPSSVLDGLRAFPSFSPEWESQRDTSLTTKQEESTNKHIHEEVREADSCHAGTDDQCRLENDPCSSDGAGDLATKAREANCHRSSELKERILDPFDDELLPGDEAEGYGIVLKHKEVATPASRVMADGRMSEILNRQMREMPRNKRLMLLSCMPQSKSSQSSGNQSRKRKTL